MAKFTKFICVDENNRPMAWSQEQLCYCDNSDWSDDPHAVKIYTKKHAEKLIRKTIEFRKQNNFHIGDYKLMPVK